MRFASLSPKEKVGKNLSLLIAGVAAALMVGVPLTRELVALYSWKFVFLGLIFIMLLSLAYFISYLPKGTHQNEVNLKLELQF
ncbi:MAG TPA: MFS transporter [Coprobacillaceae bacterium]|nr:MFS transporter [Coprobacillaceae bacterium]